MATIPAPFADQLDDAQPAAILGNSPPPYNDDFFDALVEGSRQSARQVVPLLLDWLRPQSVVDIGCGTGAWLSVFAEHGVHDYFGLDGDYVARHRLLIAPDRFLAIDLTTDWTQHWVRQRQFDLAMSLEVAEHLPSAGADRFVAALTQLANVVLFSAAIPFQGGTDHVNEQWTGYWVEKFRHQGYEPVDCIRQRIWDNPQVDPWYCQNLLLFVRSGGDYPWFQQANQESARLPLEMVHPRAYQNSLGYYTDPLRAELVRVQSEWAYCQQALLAAQGEVAAMQRSKFWRLRMRLLQLKQWFEQVQP
jgi:SAM-dependent methyltransferase